MTYIIAVAIVSSAAYLAPKLEGWVLMAIGLAVFIASGLRDAYLNDAEAKAKAEAKRNRKGG